MSECWHCGGEHLTQDHSLVESAKRVADAGKFAREESNGAWMQTFTGRAFYPLNPQPEDIAIEDIAHALGQTCRYGGHSRGFYSVAEHSVIVSRFVPPEFALHGLLHDAAEAYIGDLIRPVKNAPALRAFGQIEERIAECIALVFGIGWTPRAQAAVSEIDNRILVDERDQVMGIPPRDWNLGALRPLGARIGCLNPELAKLIFIERFESLA